MGQILSTRSLRTFVLRQGRLTAGQTKNLQDYWPQYGIEVNDSPLNPAAMFSNENPVWLEIGFGNGESLVEMAAAHPNVNFLGVEVHLPGVGHVLGEIAERELSNIRVVRYDAVELLDKYLPENAFARVMLFFPDPWHKKRHHKRRMVNEEFLSHLRRVLVPGGLLHTATDWASYAEHIEITLQQNNHFTRLLDDSTVISARPRTKFETRGIRLGHSVSDLVYQLAA